MVAEASTPATHVQARSLALSALTEPATYNRRARESKVCRATVGHEEDSREQNVGQ